MHTHNIPFEAYIYKIHALRSIFIIIIIHRIYNIAKLYTFAQCTGIANAHFILPIHISIVLWAMAATATAAGRHTLNLHTKVNGIRDRPFKRCAYDGIELDKDSKTTAHTILNVFFFLYIVVCALYVDECKCSLCFVVWCVDSLYRYIHDPNTCMSTFVANRTCYIRPYVVYFMMWLVLVSFHYYSFNPSFSYYICFFFSFRIGYALSLLLFHCAIVLARPSLVTFIRSVLRRLQAHE